MIGRRASFQIRIVEAAVGARRRPLLHGLWRRAGVPPDALQQPILHVAAQGDEAGTEIFPGAWLSQQRECRLTRLTLAEQFEFVTVQLLVFSQLVVGPMAACDGACDDA
ncbi:hypothetical protein [Mesorhizobium sp. L48C026A00]|uniref:hypothetical protein n=1 Tax=Mesorhizobium sp. L48C026A00 TaxID=1287182 RepID=UPI0003D0265D|nr:hypothetical protein [Mesorhizobium sp. L48C026A00]ESZ05767.1 hypothetical protein X737_35415 [Mesorhizobium sp. L48C026A00]